MTHVRVRKPVDAVIDSRAGVPIGIPDGKWRLLAIDQSLTATGWAFLDGQYMETGLLKPPKGLRGIARLQWFEREVLQLLRTYRPEAVVKEGYAMGIRGGRVFDLGELGGVLKLAIASQHIPIYAAPPTTLKAFATGKGNCEKAMVSKELYKRYGIDLTENNQVDAAGLAVMLAAVLSPDVHGTMTKAQQKNLTKVENLTPGAENY